MRFADAAGEASATYIEGFIARECWELVQAKRRMSRCFPDEGARNEGVMLE